MLKLAEETDAASLPESVDVAVEIERQRQKLDQLAQAETVLKARTKERYELEQAEHEAKIAERQPDNNKQDTNPGDGLPNPSFIDPRQKPVQLH